ncbi:glycosyltransferase family 4 protein [Caulobacter sp. ErkDOM-YI]|uniref:glycosyltransferase family 4 protein n=1 Tax=unclassified Caulobacter TaxID=2648921 RepID=UPI003AF70BA8
MILVYRSRAYDFDEALAAQSNVIQLSRIGVAKLLLKQRYDTVELNEPMLLSAWPSLLLYIFVIRLCDALRRSRTSIVSYAINNSDLAPAVSSYTHLPKFISEFVARMFCTILTGQYDRIAFGTPDARKTYERAIGRMPRRMAVREFPALDSACRECVQSKNPNEVIFLGSFEPRKGITRLLDAWPLVLEKNPSSRLKIVGKGPLLEQLLLWQSISPTSTIDVDPSRAEIHTHLSTAHVLVLYSQPSSRWKEQIGLPILEALSHGCEIVASSETGIAPWLLDHGHQVVPPHAPKQQLASAILKALVARRTAAEIKSELPDQDNRLLASEWLWDRS